MDKSLVRKWETTGFFFIVLAGTLLHFCFEWSGFWKPCALICAVNESVWEHLKLAFWPSVALTVLEYFSYGKSYDNLLPGKILSLYISPSAIVFMFYAYTALLGKHLLWMDILIFVLAVLFAQLVSYRITVSRHDYSKYKGLSVILFLIITAAFCLMTYFPPELPLFQDPNSSQYGIPAKK